MADVKRYGINWFNTLDLIVEIDHDMVTTEQLTKINQLSDDADYRLIDAEGNVLFAVLKLLGQRCWQLMIGYEYSADGLISHFNDNDDGWPLMDGSSGFRIIECDYLEFEACDISVSDVVE
ncbi:DUF2528 family protein [Pectobacterium sp. A535-S3-A17]|uniref:DUF2528 family protein n=1 Tax=Pectobacterium quasiaquaticum TaxID=2774015 RepID=UPI0018736C1E|nr:DUF2528 family protein [Pectobacterium quasiaquaticum]MBE5226733.1 DUF2528 family protein [Pectobacterium quasiaquaticum]